MQLASYRLRLALFLSLVLLSCPLVQAQQLTPRYGLGLGTMISSEDGVGLGLRTRISVPVNADLSGAMDFGLTGFIFSGRRDATWVFDPQLSAIVTLVPRGNSATYILTGLGAYAPLSNRNESVSGPTLHFGVGRVQMLRETTIFYEINPALVIGLDAIDFALPLRAGVIF